MTFRSILFADNAEPAPSPPQPPFFVDLNLDQLVRAVTAGREQYHLDEYYYERLRDARLIRYRQEVVRDLRAPALRDAVEQFADGMRATREQLAQAGKLRHPYQSQSLMLAAARLYTEAVARLAGHPALRKATSQGFRDLGGYLQQYVKGAEFSALVADSAHVHDALAGVIYCLLIDGSRITVSRYAGQRDYTVEVDATFARFKQGAVKDYLATLPDYQDMNHVEAQILDLVARLYPDTFGALSDFCTRYRAFIDDTVSLFDRQVQFYLGYFHVIDRLGTGAGSFCLPTVSDEPSDVRLVGAFDVVLADKLADTNQVVVANDFSVRGPERFLVVSGMNQGGKSTFARAFGQLFYLAGLGLPVPAASAQLFVPDQIFTHFEREEDPAALHGKLEDDLIRMHDILGQVTGSSIVIVNELFSSTTLADAITLGTAVLTQLVEHGCRGVCVTFVDELSRLGAATVSLVSMVDPDDPARRTFRVERRPADGLSSALVLAERYGLTYAQLTTAVTG